MNFLSHYYLDRAEATPNFTLGIILPDLITGFNQKLRRSVFQNQNLLNADHRSILAGIKRHYAVDKYFHQSPVFELHVEKIKRELLIRNIPSCHYRTYFLAHVFFEMLLDRILIKQSKQILVEFYQQLKTLNDSTVISYFSQIGKLDFLSGFFDSFINFRDKRYLFHYPDNEIFIKALLRIYSKINPTKSTPAEIVLLSELVGSFESSHSLYLLDALNDFKIQLKAA